MKKVLIINAMGLYNYGGRAVIKGAIRSLHENIPDVHIDIMSTHYKGEHGIYEKWNYRNVRVIEHIWYDETASNAGNISHALSTFSRFALYRYLYKILHTKNPYYEYDIIIDISTDSLNDHYGRYMSVFFMYNIMLAELSGKPVIISAASIGKFDKLITRSLAKLILDKVDMITVRDEITKDYLKLLGICKPKIEMTADHAFIMEPPSVQRINDILLAEGIKKDCPIIGISPSQLIHKYAFPNISDLNTRYDEYVDKMASVIIFLIEYTKGTVILIPHCENSRSLNCNPFRNDFIVSEKIFEKVKNYKKVDNDRLKLIVGEYDADELKGVISKCDIFIGCRMHPTIASTSTGVPTVAVVYGHKFHGIIGKMLGQEKCIVEIEKCSPEEFLSDLKSKIDYVWSNRQSISDELKQKIKVVQEMAFSNGKFAKELLNLK